MNYISNSLTAVENRVIDFMNPTSRDGIPLAALSENNQYLQAQPLVDYSALNILKCSDCNLLMVPPIYRCGYLKNVCNSCKNAYHQRAVNRGLNKFALRVTYPCRWRGCNYTDTAHLIKYHEESCSCRIEKCLACDKYLSLEGMLSHMQLKHKFAFLRPNQLIVKLTAKKVNVKDKNECDNEKCFVTYVDSEVVGLIYKFKERRSEHSFTIVSTAASEDIFGFYVHFEHKHCKFATNIFSFSKTIVICTEKYTLPVRAGVGFRLNLPEDCKKFGKFVAIFNVVKKGIEAEYY